MTEEEYDACYGTSITGLLSQRAPLTELERNRLFKETEEASRDAMIYLSKSEAQFSQIVDIKIRNICTSAVVGAIVSITSPSKRAQAISIALSVVSNYFMNACDHFWEAYDFLNISRKYAHYADQCQDRLLRP